jgi:hypothetical protein
MYWYYGMVRACDKGKLVNFLYIAHIHYVVRDKFCFKKKVKVSHESVW